MVRANSALNSLFNSSMARKPNNLCKINHFDKLFIRTFKQEDAPITIGRGNGCKVFFKEGNMSRF
jgi:hypothetical protein